MIAMVIVAFLKKQRQAGTHSMNGTITHVVLHSMRRRPGCIGPTQSCLWFAALLGAETAGMKPSGAFAQGSTSRPSRAFRASQPTALSHPSSTSLNGPVYSTLHGSEQEGTGHDAARRPSLTGAFLADARGSLIMYRNTTLGSEKAVEERKVRFSPGSR